MSSLKKDTHYLKAYCRYLVRYKGLLSFACVLVPVISLVHVVQPLFIKHGIDQNIMNGDTVGLYHTALLFGLCVVIECTAKSTQSFLFQYIGQKTVSEVRSDLFVHVLRLSPTYFDKTPLGKVTTRLTSDIESLNDSFASGLVTLVGDLLSLAFILILMFWLSPKLTVITVLVVPPLMVMVNFFRKKLRYFFNLTRTLKSRINATLQEQLQGIHIVQLFGRERRNFREFNDLSESYRKSVISSVKFDALLYSLIESMSSIMIALMIWYGFGEYVQGTITLGLLAAFVDYIHRFFQPLKELSNKFAILQNALSALEKIFGTFEIDDRIDAGEVKIPNFTGKVTFKHVRFAYRGYEEKRVLDDISFTIHPKEVVAIVGPTGSGKSTIGRLLLRLYDGFEGQILLDDVPLQTIDLGNLRSQIAVVSQDVQLFEDTITANIAVGNPEVTPQKVREIAALIELDQFVEQLPQGFDTVLSRGHASLSAGQAQLISMARALVSPAPLVLLDEATASIDSLSEQRISRAIDAIFHQKSVLVIAHRLSTIQKANTILALKDGRVIESGTHGALLAADGFYAKLFKVQFSES